MSEPILPPGVWIETFTHADGKTENILKRRMAEEGPHTRVDRAGVRHLVYMYGHWVFHWPEVSKTVTIGFGTIESHTVEQKDVPIDLAWSGENLVAFARQWRQDLIKRVT